MGTIHNIDAINYIINRQIEKKEEKLVALFVDLKAVFDSVDRDRLIGAMKERGMREEIVGRVEQVIRETKCRVRVEEKDGNCFLDGERDETKVSAQPYAV